MNLGVLQACTRAWRTQLQSSNAQARAGKKEDLRLDQRACVVNVTARVNGQFVWLWLFAYSRKEARYLESSIPRCLDTRFLDTRFIDSQMSRICILDMYESRCAKGMYKGLEDTLPLLSSRFRSNLQYGELYGHACNISPYLVYSPRSQPSVRPPIAPFCH